MREVEFYMTPQGEVMLRQEGLPEHQLKEQDRLFIQSFIAVLEEFYPEAFEMLKKEYIKSEKNRAYYEFLIVRRFIKCNFGNYDNMLDVDSNWNFKFEFVSCPLRGECKAQGVICGAKFNSKLSDRQLDVMHLCVEGKTDEEIAGDLYITIDTVKNHRKNSFKKTGIHSMAEFIRYAHKNNIFNTNK